MSRLGLLYSFTLCLDLFIGFGFLYSFASCLDYLASSVSFFFELISNVLFSCLYLVSLELSRLLFLHWFALSVLISSSIFLSSFWISIIWLGCIFISYFFVLLSCLYLISMLIFEYSLNSSGCSQIVIFYFLGWNAEEWRGKTTLLCEFKRLDWQNVQTPFSYSLLCVRHMLLLRILRLKYIHD